MRPPPYVGGYEVLSAENSAEEATFLDAGRAVWIEHFGETTSPESFFQSIGVFAKFEREFLLEKGHG